MFTLTQALEAIKNRPEFSVKERDYGTVIDYNLMMKDTFDGANASETLVLKNLRGTCFNKDGVIISLAFDKFHNLNECNGWMVSDIDFSKPHEVLLKLDGSMIRAIPTDSGFVLATRAGVTDVSKMADDYVDNLPDAKRDNIYAFISMCIKINRTPIFEFTSRENRVVIDYPETKLVLTAVRHNAFGEYTPYEKLKEYARFYGLDLVEQLSGTDETVKYLESVRAWDKDEGVVVVFKNGFRVKVKSDDYCMKHRALDGLRFEKDVLALVLSGKLDDVLPLVDDDTKKRLSDYRDSVMESILLHQIRVAALFTNLNEMTRNKKEFAELASKHIYRSALFKMYDGKIFSFTDYALKKCGSSTDVENIRWLIGKSYSEFL